MPGRATVVPVRRYERDLPGELIHFDVKKLGNIPDGVGWRTVGRRQDKRNALAPLSARAATRSWATATCTQFQTTTRAWPAPRSCPTSARTPRPAPQPASSASAPGPTGPQTEGKIERFHRALAEGWACARPDSTQPERHTALPDWLHTYNSHRGHTALGARPPAASPSCQVITASRGASWPGRWSCWLSGRPRVTRTEVGSGPGTRHHPLRPGSNARASGAGDDIGERGQRPGPARLEGLGVAGGASLPQVPR